MNEGEVQRVLRFAGDVATWRQMSARLNLAEIDYAIARHADYPHLSGPQLLPEWLEQSRRERMAARDAARAEALAAKRHAETVRLTRWAIGAGLLATFVTVLLECL